MRLLNWNIRHGGNDIDAISKAIASHAPDVVVVTEFKRVEKGNRLRVRLADMGLSQSESCPLAPDKSNSVLVAAKVPMRPSALRIPETLSAHAIAVELRGLSLIGAFCNNDRCGDAFVAWLGEFAFEKGARILAVGDFFHGRRGSDPNRDRLLTPAIDAGWKDLWRECHGDATAWSFRSGSRRSQPDHVFATPAARSFLVDVRFSERELAEGLSDHSPMIADFREGLLAAG